MVSIFVQIIPLIALQYKMKRTKTIRYEIDVGIDFNVFINGIELMGVGDDNLYKI